MGRGEASLLGLRGSSLTWVMVRLRSLACKLPLFCYILTWPFLWALSWRERQVSISSLLCKNTAVIRFGHQSFIYFFTHLISCLGKTCLQLQLLWRFPPLHRDWWRLEYRLWCCPSRSIYIFTEWVRYMWTVRSWAHLRRTSLALSKKYECVFMLTHHGEG